jgi:hypothetical protein
MAAEMRRRRAEMRTNGWVTLVVFLGLLMMVSACATTSSREVATQFEDEKRAQAEQTCRIRMGWDDPMCKLIDEDAAQSMGGP